MRLERVVLFFLDNNFLPSKNTAEGGVLSSIAADDEASAGSTHAAIA
jgi:hypothetical protein